MEVLSTALDAHGGRRASLERPPYRHLADESPSRTSTSSNATTGTRETQIWAPAPSQLRISTSPSISSSIPASPDSADPRTALHSHPTSPTTGSQPPSLSRRTSAESFTLDTDDKDVDRLSTIPEHESRLSSYSTRHRRTSTVDSSKSITTNFSRPLNAQDSRPSSAISFARPLSSRAAPASANGDPDLVSKLQQEPRTQSRSSQLSANKVKYSTRSMFGLPFGNEESLARQISSHGSEESERQHMAGRPDSAVSVRPILRSQPGSSHSGSNASGLTATRRILEADRDDITLASSASSSSRAYPPSIASDYSAAPAPDVSRGRQIQQQNNKTTVPAPRPQMGRRTFSASTYDISSLSEKKLQKLRKRGIDPALHLEMKAAQGKKGKFNTTIGHAPL